MSFFFSNFNFTSTDSDKTIYFSDFYLSYYGSDTANIITPSIYAYTASSDFYLTSQNISNYIIISLTEKTINALPQDLVGWEIERSEDLGYTWSKISTIEPTSIFYIDTNLNNSVYYYRARLKLLNGLYSNYSNIIICQVGVYTYINNSYIYEIDNTTNNIIDALGINQEYPEGLDNNPILGGYLSTGSVLGSTNGGIWIASKTETDASIRLNENPPPNAIDVSLNLSNFTFDIQDQPYPGGSGIDDTSWKITLAVSSRFDGKPVLIRDGNAQPFSSTVACTIIQGTDPTLDRTITITPASGYIQPDDTVTIGVQVKDLSGNIHISSYSFTMEHVDVTAPLIQNQQPACGTGININTQPVLRDTDFSFDIYDDDSGVDISSLQVYIGNSNTGPWTQIINNGIPILYRAIITQITNGYNVVIKLPKNQLWAAGSDIYFKIVVFDNEINGTENICGFKVEDEYTIKQVIPLSEQILFVEFTGSGCLNNAALYQKENYQIEPIDTNAQTVYVRAVTPQKFLLPQDLENPTQRLGEGYPRCVILDTSKHTHWGKYKLTVTNLRDRYGQPFKSPTNIIYKARPTKFDQMKWSLYLPDLIYKDSMLRRLLLSIAQQDDWIGGRFHLDDWDE